MIPIKKIQKWLINESIDIFLINRTDEFLSEYLAPYAERLNWISKFSGSNGRAIIESNKAYIFVDGRYTNQVNAQVDRDNFKIKHISNYWPFLKKYKNKKKILAFDPKLHSINEVKKMQKIYEFTKIKLNFLEKNPIDINWHNQPKRPRSSVFIHPKKYSGEESFKKIKKIRFFLLKNNIDFYFLNSLDSIAWLLNIRGNDIAKTPLIQSHIIIPKSGKIELFINKEKILNKNVIDYLKSLVNIYPEENIDRYIYSIKKNKIIGMDDNITSFFFKNICNKVNLKTNNFENPCLYPKAIKNKIELKGAKNANLRDGISVTKFIHWLKTKRINNHTDEILAAKKLFNFRKNNYLFYSLSFDTISALGPNAALPHYHVTKETNLKFTNNSIYLVDSGAQYFDGTTDITRTIVIGNATKDQKDKFTRVLKGHIAIAESTFLLDTRGSQIDSVARKSLNEINCDYDHGTGHGIGSFLSVHEGPQKFIKDKNKKDGILKRGMIISNEPGFYKKGKYGIRTENLLICKYKSNHFYFETISFVPIDKDLINIDLLNYKEINWLNKYHEKVYKNIGGGLNSQEKKWLKIVTAPIIK